MELLRFITTGNVDDGKSTLIGRLLYDSRALLRDQIEEIERSSQKRGTELNLALITDGLRSEREQGITIDVAYRFFSTSKRKFVIIDAPGHVQYTRNVVTGASGADVGLVIVDATKGLQEQTKRHSYLLSLLGVAQVIVCVNKMDLLGYSKDVMDSIQSEYMKLAEKFRFHKVHFLPVSALNGDNVVTRSTQISWYNGPALLELLEQIEVERSYGPEFRFPVQQMIRTGGGSSQDFRACAGMVMGGSVSVGDELTVYPSGMQAKVRAIHKHPARLEKAQPGESVAIEIDRDLDIDRGDVLVRTQERQPEEAREITPTVCWFFQKDLTPGSRWILRQGTSEVRCVVDEIEHKVDIHTLEEVKSVQSLAMNDIGRIRVRLSKPLHFDSYLKNSFTGCGILIDEVSNSTVAALML